MMKRSKLSPGIFCLSMTRITQPSPVRFLITKCKRLSCIGSTVVKDFIADKIHYTVSYGLNSGCGYAVDEMEFISGERYLCHCSSVSSKIPKT